MGKKVIHTTKAEFEAAGQKVEVDFSDMEKRLNDNIDKKFNEVKESIEKTSGIKDKNGKGIVEAFSADKKKVVLEELQKGKQMNFAKLKEQWTIAVPFYASNELAGHLRDYVFVTDVVNGKAGETVNIPYIKDITFGHVTPKSGGFTAKTGLINVQTTTLHESGAYYDAYYGDVEKIDSNALDELNRVFAHAAICAEDADLVDLLATPTTADFYSPGATTRQPVTNPVLGDTLSYFQIGWLANGIGQLMQRGKEVRPNDCILVMGPENYGALLKQVVASTPWATTKPGVFTQGLVEDLLGVKIVVTGRKPHEGSATPVVGGPTTIGCVYLIRPKRALALAPKRDILIETDKLIDMRQLRIAGSHTYGILALDESEMVRFRTAGDADEQPLPTS